MAERRPNRQSSTSTSSSRNTASTLAGESRNSVRYSNPDIFSDEFALEPLEIADGFRPVSPTLGDATPFVPAPQPNGSERQPRNFQPPAATPSETFRRGKGSQSQPFGRGNYLPLRQDARFPRREPSMASVSDASHPTRTLSTASTFTIPRTQSPYQGAMGPSHPYGMYPQDIGLARTPSAATQSTTRAPDRIYAGPNGPTHPYGMYPQNTVPEGAVSPVAEQAPPMPVGFPGLGQDYRRRFGPEGEEADDIIGPDGHTEQLPPYTRYPDAFLPKRNRSGAAAAGTTLETQPETSQTTLTNSQSGLSTTPTVTFDDGRPPLISPVQADGSGNFKERWSEKSKKRFCNGKVPMWVLVVIVAIFLVLLGGILGGMLDHRHGGHKEDDQVPPAPPTQLPGVAAPSTVIATVTATSVVDATPLSSIPPDLPPLPTGTFGVPLSSPILSSNSCLTDASQSSAWSCVPAGYLGIDVTIGTDSPNPVSDQVFLTPTTGHTAPIRYGPQPPGLNSACNLSLEWDKSDLGRGPAYFFQQQFNKIVIVQENVFNTGYSKRGLDEDLAPVEERDWESSQNLVSAGQKPWYCFWNDTIIEGFIYLEQNTTAANTSLMSAPSSSSPSSVPSSSSAAASMSNNPSGQFTSAIKASVSAQVASHMPTGTPPKRKRDQGSLPPYPKVIKIEERRNQVTTVKPYCQQMHMLDSMVLVPVWDPKGKPVVFNLTELEQLSQNAVLGPKSRRGSWGWGRPGEGKRNAGPAGNCSCEWVVE
ncbi:hypothetical protein LPUS_03831 [Lasallia pustulata]|uniref:DUF7820 domain-containing protein n=1 Tax=Lasallia pustulata TaxID=136370 RepID=A0A1W5CVH9_9LECA|nr:hypothetical protein LPUS_03831 [Lasallia pustulata]